MDDFVDQIKLGLKTHYNPINQSRIRRYMLEDWKASGVKLPTYMKLVARFVEKDLPENFLSKLIHQTMNKMLKQEITPRYEFWAALHYYLKKKYGDAIDINRKQPRELEQLGEALVRFGDIETDVKVEGLFMAGNQTFYIKPVDEQHYSTISLRQSEKSDDLFADEITVTSVGAVVAQEDGLTGIAKRTDNDELEAVELRETSLAPAHDKELEEELKALGEMS